MTQNDDRCPKTHKRCYVDRDDAKRSARAIATKGLGIMTEYRCEHCNYFHIGHSTAAERASQRGYRRAIVGQ